jgi:hypothetical protein
MITVLNLLVSLFLTMAGPAPAPTTPAPAAAKQCYGCCPCPIGMKDWGK